MSDDGSVEKKSDGYVVYQLRAKEDGSIDVTLSHTHKMFLLLLRDRAGETPYDYALVKPELKEHMRLLVKMGIITETPIIGSDTRFLLRLTSMGRNLIPEIERMGV